MEVEGAEKSSLVGDVPK